MKVSSSTQSSAFKPVDLDLTFETVAEIQAFYALFNCPKVVDAMALVGFDSSLSTQIRQAITNQCPGINALTPNIVEALIRNL